MKCILNYYRSVCALNSACKADELTNGLNSEIKILSHDNNEAISMTTVQLLQMKKARCF